MLILHTVLLIPYPKTFKSFKNKESYHCCCSLFFGRSYSFLTTYTYQQVVNVGKQLLCIQRCFLTIAKTRRGRHMVWQKQPYILSLESNVLAACQTVFGFAVVKYRFRLYAFPGNGSKKMFWRNCMTVSKTCTCLTILITYFLIENEIHFLNIVMTMNIVIVLWQLVKIIWLTYPSCKFMVIAR